MLITNYVLPEAPMCMFGVVWVYFQCGLQGLKYFFQVGIELVLDRENFLHKSWFT